LGDFATLSIANDTRPAVRYITMSSIANGGPWQKPINRHSVTILHKFTMAVVKNICQPNPPWAIFDNTAILTSYE